jgi:NCS1 family nucleobase:cation symporter-1
VIFVVVSIWVLSKAHPGAASKPIPGAFLIMFGATFGYAAGWNPYAADYTRYLQPDAKRAAVGFWAALGVFWSCVLLETAGAAVVTAGKHAVEPASFTSLVPTWLGKLTLLGIVLGAICANALNMYSGSMSFMAMGVRLPTSTARALVALVLGVAGFFVALAFLNNTTGSYENFLLVISYWIAPWLGVVFVDRLLRRGTDSQLLMGDSRYANWAGPISMLVGGALAIWLFANQTDYVGVVPKHNGAFGDLAFEVGFVLAAVLYAVLFKLRRPVLGPPSVQRPDLMAASR